MTEEEEEGRQKDTERRNTSMYGDGQSVTSGWIDQKPTRVKHQEMIKSNITITIKRD